MSGQVIGHGIDLVENARIARSVEMFGERFLDRVFTTAEIEYCRRQADPVPHLAVRWAAKEAVGKAFGTGLGEQIGWLDIEVTRDAGGRPGIMFHGDGACLAETAGVRVAQVSLSHTKDYAMASVLLVGRG
ncbi:MAG: holo-ACP synthase [Candidatus Methylacidiphilales bacterium]